MNDGITVGRVKIRGMPLTLGCENKVRTSYINFLIFKLYMHIRRIGLPLGWDVVH